MKTIQEERNDFVMKNHHAPWAVFLVCGDNPDAIRDAFDRRLMTLSNLREAFSRALIAGNEVRRLVYDILTTEAPLNAVRILRKELEEVRDNLMKMSAGGDIDPCLMAEAITATLQSVEGVGQ